MGIFSEFRAFYDEDDDSYDEGCYGDDVSDDDCDDFDTGS